MTPHLIRIIFIQTNIFCHYLTFLYSGHINFFIYHHSGKFLSHSTNQAFYQAFPFAISHFLGFRKTIFSWLSVLTQIPEHLDLQLSCSSLPLPPGSPGITITYIQDPTKAKPDFRIFQKDPAPSAATPCGVYSSWSHFSGLSPFLMDFRTKTKCTTQVSYKKKNQSPRFLCPFT